MFEKALIRKRFYGIISDLSRSSTLAVSPRVDIIFDGWWNEAADAMKRNGWSALQAVTAMVTMVAAASEASGHNRDLKQRDPVLYCDFKNLYTFLAFAVKNNAEVAVAFVYPNDGDPKPFV